MAAAIPENGAGEARRGEARRGGWAVVERADPTGRDRRAPGPGPARERGPARRSSRGGPPDAARAEPAPPAASAAFRAGLFALLVLVLLWPAAWNGGPLGFFDTEGYYEQGGQVIEFLRERLAPTPALPAAGEATAAAPGEGRLPALRSLPFAVATNASMRLMGLWGPIVILAAITAWLILVAVRDLVPRRAALAALGAAGLTTLPFYTSLIMADVMAGWLLLIACLLALEARRGAGATLALLVLAFLAIASHYSHVPLGMALMPALGLVLLARRRWGLAAAVQIPLVLALGLNMAVGKVTTGGVSLAPARLPILLARTLADGPGRDYLIEACPEAGWTLCEIYDEFPTNVGQALWGEDAIRARASPAQTRAIAREEVPLVLAVLREHPVEQSLALARNAVLQLTLIGLDDVRLTTLAIEGPDAITVDLDRVPRASPVHRVEWVQWAAVAAGALGLVVAAWRGGGGARPAAALLVLGLLANAAVCGGLSAPVDRYQGRIIWVLVLMGLALAPRPRATRAREGWTRDRRGRLVRPGARGAVRRA